MNLFDYIEENNTSKNKPLAVRMRPTSISDFVGQKHLLGEKGLLSNAIKNDFLTSIILYGNPGTGKTTLAKIIANSSSAEFIQINATTAGKVDLEKAIKTAKDNMAFYDKKTILFIDEIHRFNKAQQDFLLPHVEDGVIKLIGATTENPYFEVNKALLSRSFVFNLLPLKKEEIIFLLKQSLKKEEGLKSLNVSVKEEVLSLIASIANGDARIAYNILEMAVFSKSLKESIELTKEDVENVVGEKIISYDKNGDNHYDVVSAFIKSMRGSDPDASLYYLAKMIEAGEDINFIARRIVIAASEDVGNADPMALLIANAAVNSINFVGMPEARIILSQAVLYIATAKKSNASYLGIDAAIKAVRKTNGSVPKHLRDAHYEGAEKLGNGISYKYPHNYKNAYVKQQYLPDELVGEKFYFPTENGYEKKIRDYLNNIEGDTN